MPGTLNCEQASLHLGGLGYNCKMSPSEVPLSKTLDPCQLQECCTLAEHKSEKKDNRRCPLNVPRDTHNTVKRKMCHARFRLTYQCADINSYIIIIIILHCFNFFAHLVYTSFCQCFVMWKLSLHFKASCTQVFH